MNVVTALMVFSALAAVICTKARAAGPAVFFGVFAVALLTATPLGAELRELVESGIEQASRATAGWCAMTAAEMPDFPARPADISVTVAVQSMLDRYHVLRYHLLGHRCGIGQSLSGEQAAAHSLAELTTARAIADAVLYGRWVAARDALTAGAALPQIAAAMGLEPVEVGPGLREWADGQHRHGRMSDAEHERVLVLLCRPETRGVDR